MTRSVAWSGTGLATTAIVLGAAAVLTLLSLGCTSTGGEGDAGAQSSAAAVSAPSPTPTPVPAPPPVGTSATGATNGSTADGPAAPEAGDGVENEDLDDSDAPVSFSEQVLAECDAARGYWREGSFDDALAALDHAYALLLQMPDNGDPVRAQEKADLRHLISRRVVEVYASRQTAVGEPDLSIPVVVNPYVEAEIRSFQTVERSFFVDAYQRSGRFRPMIVEELAKAGLPEQLSWLPLIESGYKVRALSTARALGLWQFIASTGARYGLRRDSWVDERMDPEKATRGAIAYLTELHGLFGDWMTAIAGYNCGEQTVLRLINRQKINYLDQFWDLYAQLPRETARYVPRFLATLLVVSDPQRYGFELPTPDQPIRFSTIPVERSVRLAELEKSLGLEAGALQDLNPELRHRATPKTLYDLRVPLGVEQGLLASLAAVPQLTSPPADEIGVYRVRRGDTLGRIAASHGTTVERLKQLNNLRNPNTLSVGQRIRVPQRGAPPAAATVPTATTSAAAAPPPVAVGSPAAPVPSGTVKHTVARGENMWLLAERYGTTPDRIRQENRLPSTRLQVGQVLTITAGAEPHGGAGPSRGSYVVQRGDTPASIARSHDVDLDRLLTANSLTRRSTIYPGQELVIP